MYIVVYLNQLGEELNVVRYSDRPELRNMGVAASFYERLREAARKMGFSYITGANTEENSGYYTKKLGRTTLDKLPPNLQHMFHDNHFDLGIESDELFTVDFLNSDH